MSQLIVVTGAGGAIGQNVVRELASRGVRVIGLGHGMRQEHSPVSDWINGEIDAANLGSLASRWGRPDAIIHLAGGAAVGPSLVAPVEDFMRTAATTVRLLEWIRHSAPETPVVLASSAAVYGDQHSASIPETAPRTPFSPYGYHKAMMEMAGECWARNFGLRIAIIRLFSVYGQGLRKQLIWEICTRLKQGARTLALGGIGTETRDWLHIQDASAMLIYAIDLASAAAPIYNACTGQAISVVDAARLIIEGFGASATITFDGRRRPGDPMHLVGNSGRALAVGLVAAQRGEDGLVSLAREVKAEHAA